MNREAMYAIMQGQMTDNRGATYGVVRDSLSRRQGHAAA
jgi:hypothetical protein